jgi:hypothetical protein
MSDDFIKLKRTSETLGLTRQEYRGAQRCLKRWGLAAFKPTSHGTVARLLNHRIFDVTEITPGKQ